MKDSSARWKRYRAANIKAFLAEHGEPPICECGCGEHVAFGSTGKPNRYVNHHFKANTIEANKKRLDDTIPIEDWRRLVHEIKARKGMTWDQFAEKAGMSRGHVTSMMFGTQRSVSKEWARQCLERLSGRPTTITAHQRRQIAKRRKADAEIRHL